MCSIANLFDTNKRKFEAKKRNFFCPEYLPEFSLRTKLVYLRLNFSLKSKASNLRQSKLSASYKESVAVIFQSVNVIFLTWKS